MSAELRWVLPEDRSSVEPRLQYRTKEFDEHEQEWHWTDWRSVPVVVIPAEHKPRSAP